MFNVPAIQQAMILVGLDQSALAFEATPHVSGGQSPGDRLRLASAMSFGPLWQSYTTARVQRGIEPVMVIACADCESGRILISKLFGGSVCAALTGPMVCAWSEQDAAAALGDGWKKLSDVFDKIGSADGGMRVLFAVNGGAVEPRVLRLCDPEPEAPSSPAPVAPVGVIIPEPSADASPVEPASAA